MPEWERRLAQLWESLDDLEEDEFLARMDAVAAEVPDPGVAAFERACARDSTATPTRPCRCTARRSSTASRAFGAAAR